MDRQSSKSRHLPSAVHSHLVDNLSSLPGIDFHQIRFEELDFNEQLWQAHDTDVMIGCHGNGLSHIMFMPPRRTVVELVPEHNGLQYDYFVMSRLMGHEHVLVAHNQFDNVYNHNDAAGQFFPGGFPDVSLTPSVVDDVVARVLALAKAMHTEANRGVAWRKGKTTVRG